MTTGTTIVGALVFDCTALREWTSVRFVDGLVTDCGTGEVTRPGDEVVDGTGATLLPGLIDAHTHLLPGVPQQALTFGVTTELDMFSKPDLVHRLKAEAAARPDVADVRSSGIGATASGGHPSMMYAPFPTVTVPDDAWDSSRTGSRRAPTTSRSSTSRGTADSFRCRRSTSRRCGRSRRRPDRTPVTAAVTPDCQLSVPDWLTPRGAAVTVLPQQPAHLLTVAEYAELGETESGYTELVEGRLLMSPSPVPDHNYAASELLVQLRPQLPDHLEVIPDVDVDLELVSPDKPGFSRRPDLIVAQRAARQRVREGGGMIRAAEVLVVVEIVSPGSRRTDHVAKRSEYADAGIPHYWIVDLDTPLSVLACHLAEGFGYQDAGGVVGGFTTTEPFAVRLELDRLL